MSNRVLVQIMRPNLITGAQYAIYTLNTEAERERSSEALAQWISPVGATFTCKGCPNYIPPRYMATFDGRLSIPSRKFITDVARAHNPSNPPFTRYIHSRVDVPHSVLRNSKGDYPPLPPTNGPSIDGISFTFSNQNLGLE